MKDEKEDELQSQLFSFVAQKTIHAKKWAVISRRSASLDSRSSSPTKGNGESLPILSETDETPPEISVSGPTEAENGTSDDRHSFSGERLHFEEESPSTQTDHSATADVPPPARPRLLSTTSSNSELTISTERKPRRDSLVGDLVSTSAEAFIAGLTGLDIFSDEDGVVQAADQAVTVEREAGFKRRDTRRLAGPSGEVLYSNKHKNRSILDIEPTLEMRDIVERALWDSSSQRVTTQSTLIPPQLSSTLLSSDRDMDDSDDSSDNTVADLLDDGRPAFASTPVSVFQGKEPTNGHCYSSDSDEDEASFPNDQMNSILAPITAEHVRATSGRGLQASGREEPDFEELERYFPNHQMSLFIGTWNMHSEKDVPMLVNDFLMPPECDLLQDMYVLGTQECSPHRREWEVTVQATLGPTHVLVRSESLGDIHLMVLVRREMIWIMRDVQSCTVACGAGGVMRNKGAVAIILTVFGTSILLVTAHLRAHASKVKERNYETERIASSLDFSRYPTEKHHQGIFDKVDCVFWFGDLNYRNTCERHAAEEAISRGDLLPLLECDQLTQQVREKQTLPGFSEATISFPPTFKFDPGTSNYDTSAKQRVPSWTDRILYRSAEDSITNRTYHHCPSLTSSDHRPVFGVYLVTLKPSPISLTIRAASGWFDKRAYAQGMKRRQYIQKTRSSLSPTATKEHLKQPSLIMKAVHGPAKVIASHKRSSVCSLM